MAEKNLHFHLHFHGGLEYPSAYLQDSVNVWLQVINAPHPLTHRAVGDQPVLQLHPSLLHHLSHPDTEKLKLGEIRVML